MGFIFKYLDTYNRNSQNILTPFILMSIENNIVDIVNKENMINEISNSSTELKILLQ